MYDPASVPTVVKFWESDKFLRYIQGPFGSGKSSGCVMEVMRRASRQAPGADGVRRSRCAVVRNTYPQLNDSTIKTFLDWFPNGQWGKYVEAKHNYNLKFRLEDGSFVECEVLFRALDKPQHVSNLLSVEYTFAWLNEMREIDYEIFQAIQGRVDRYPSRRDGVGPTWSGVWGDSNPPDTDHWIYRVFEEDRPDNAAAFYQPSGLSKDAENMPHLSPSYYTNMAKGKSKDWVNIYVHGRYGFTRDGKPVFPEYNDDVHCAEFEVNPRVPFHRGWDFGLTPACVFVQSYNGRLFFFDEVTSDRAGITRFADDVITQTNREWRHLSLGIDGCDPAGDQAAQTDEKTVYDIMYEKGLMPEPGDQSLEARLESIRKLLNTMVDGQPALLIHPRCKKLRKAFQGMYKYRRMQTSGEKYTDKPDKGEYSHVADAAQYIATLLNGLYVPQRRRKIKANGSLGW